MSSPSHRASDVYTSAPADLIPLQKDESDDVSFIDIASRLVTASATFNKLPMVYTIHVDNWFGDRWLGFRGKLLGIAGVRNRTLKRSLVLPPFHPHRVLGGTEYHLSDAGHYEERGDLSSLHKHQPSQENLDRPIRRHTLYAWYSGNTIDTRKGVVMVYFSTPELTKAWYVMFNGDADWRLDRHIGITPARSG